MKKSLLIAIILIATILMLTLSACSTEGIPIVEELTIIGSPVTEYRRGADIDLKGAQLKVRMSDGNEIVVPIDESMLTIPSMNEISTKTVLIKYREGMVSFAINIVDSPVISVAINTEPAKKNYIEGEELNLNGGYINVNYDLGEPSIIPITANMISNYNRNVVGEQTVKVNYEGHFASFKVNVRSKQVIGLKIEQFILDSIYTADDTLNLTGGKLRITYDNGTHEIADMDKLEGLDISYDLEKTVSGKATVTLTYKNKQASFTVNVVENAITSYSFYKNGMLLDSLPTQKVNNALDLSGVEIELRYSDGDKERISLADINPADGLVSIEGYNANIIGTQTLALAFYNGLFADGIEIKVLEKRPESLEVSRPTTTIYQDSIIDIADWTYTVTYDNGAVLSNQPLTAEMVEGGQASLASTANAGELKLNIAFFDQTGEYVEIEYPVDIVALTIEQYKIIPQTTRVVYVNHELNLTGIMLDITYNSGKNEQVQLLGTHVNNFDKSELGEQTVSVAYLNKYGRIDTGFAVKVIRKAVSLEVLSLPAKLRYVKGESFDVAGMQINIKYEDEDTPTLVTEFGSEWQGIDTTFNVIDFDEVQNKYNPVMLQLVYTNSEMDENQVDISLEIQVINDLEYIELAKEDESGSIVVIDDFSEPFTTVLEGIKIDTQGFYIILHFENGESEQIPLNYEKHITDFDYTNPTPGIRSLKIKVTKHGKMYILDETTVEVIARSIIGIEIDPTQSYHKIIYDADPENELEVTGIYINVLFDNETSFITHWNDSDLEFSGFVAGESGEQTITITYLEQFSTTYIITVAEPRVEALNWRDDITPQLYITQGQDLIFPEELEILVTTQFGGSYYIFLTDILNEIEVEDFDPGDASSQQPRIVYQGIKLAFMLEVGSRELVNIQFAPNSVIPDVKEGMDLDLNNARLIAYFDNDTQKEVFIRQSYTDYNKDNLTTGPRSIVVSYTHNEVVKQLTATINVLPKKLANIELITMPKIYYIEGEAFTLLSAEGISGKIRVNYDNETYEEKLLTDATIGDATKAFNIDISAFDNREFSGTNQAQRIVINYTIGTITRATEYNISMNDRLYAKVKFDTSNVYEFYYGSTTMPNYDLMGYAEYDKTLEEPTIILSDSVISYINLETQEESSVLPTDVGTYRIAVSYAGNSIHNALLDTTKTITIYPKAIFVYAENAQKTYGEENPEISIKFLNPVDGKAETAFAYGEDGSAFGDTLDINYQTSSGVVLTSIEKKTAVGQYSIMLSGLQSHNYSISYTFEGYSVGIVTINRRDIVIEAHYQERIYGVSNIILTYDVSGTGQADSGLVAGDTLQGGLMRPSNNNVGEYSITQGDLVNANNNNYNVDFISNTVKITKKDIYVVADGLQRVYGDDNPVLTVKYYAEPAPIGGGLRNPNAFAYTDTPTSLGTLIMTTVATSSSNVGTYDVMPSGLASSNYEIYYEKGYITVSTRPIEVEAYFATPEDGFKVYGTADPEQFSYRINPIEGNSSSGIIEGDSLAGKITRVTTSGFLNDPVGEYTILQGDLTNSNYTITNFVSVKFAVIKRNVTLEIDTEKLNRAYNGLAPSITSSDFTLYNAYNIGSDNVANRVSIAFTNGSRNVGSYTAYIVNDDNNHNITFSNPEGYTFIITQKQVRIQFAQVEGSDFIELQDELVFKDTAYNFVANIHPEDICTSDQVQVALNLYTATEVGNYTIIVQSLDNYNYALPSPLPTKVIHIAKRELTLFLKEANEETNEIRVIYTNTQALVNKYMAEIKDAEGNILYDDGIYSSNIPEFKFNVFVINPSGASIPPFDVRFDEDDNIIGYEIGALLTEEFFARNNVLTLAYDYSFIIEKAMANIVIISSSGVISKEYDAAAPSIPSNYISVQGSTINLSDLAFNFTRHIESGDETDYTNWSNSDVGTYLVDVDFKPQSENKNYILHLDEDYKYVITTRKNVSLRINGANLSKSYDGLNAELVATDFYFTNYHGIVSNSLNTGRLSIQVTWVDSIRKDVRELEYGFDVECIDRNHEVSIGFTRLFTINPRPVTFTRIYGSKIYGEQDPTITYDLRSDSLADGESLFGVITRSEGENVGSYSFDITDLEEKNLNYLFSPTQAQAWTFNIEHKEIVIFIKDKQGGDDISAIYGEFSNIANYIEFVIDPTGLVSGDNEGDVGLLEYPQSYASCEVAQRSNAGVYEIRGNVVFNPLSNYKAVLDTSAIFTVKRAPIQLVLNYNDQFEIMYGLSEDDFSPKYSGYKFPTDPTDILEYKPNYNIINGSALQGSGAGSIFTVTLSHQNGGSNTNYYFDFAESYECKLLITRAPLTIKLKPISGEVIETIYGEEPDYSFGFEGFVLDEGPDHPNYINPNFEWFRDAGRYVEDSGVIPSVDTQEGFYANYSVTYERCDYEVFKRTLYVAIDTMVGAFTIAGADAYSADWLALTNNGIAFTPEQGRVYMVVSTGDYYRKTYTWTGSSYQESEIPPTYKTMHILSGADLIRYKLEDVGEDDPPIFGGNYAFDVNPVLTAQEQLQYGNIPYGLTGGDTLESLFINIYTGKFILYWLDGVKSVQANELFTSRTAYPAIVDYELTNYNFVGIQREVVVHTYLTSFEIVQDELLLDDGENGAVIWVRATRQDNEQMLLNINEAGFSYSGYQQSNMYGNQTLSYITYSEPYIGKGDFTVIGAPSISNITINNQIIRVYSTQEQGYYSNQLKNQNNQTYSMGAEVQSGNEYRMKDTNNQLVQENYDKVYLTARFSNLVMGNYFSLILNTQGSNTLAVVINEQGMFIKETGQTDIYIDGTDFLTDGYIHDMLFILNKREGGLTVSIDGILLVNIDIPKTRYGDSAISGFDVVGMSAWVKDYRIARQGYTNKLGVSVTNADNEIVYVLNSGSSDVQLNLNNFFNYSQVKNLEAGIDYFVIYKVNNMITYQDALPINTVTGNPLTPVDHVFTAGSYNIECLVYDNFVDYNLVAEFNAKIVVRSRMPFYNAKLAGAEDMPNMKDNNKAFGHTFAGNDELIATTDTQSSAITLASGIDANYNKVSMVFELDRASYQGQYRTIKQGHLSGLPDTDNFAIISLKSNHNDYNAYTALTSDENFVGMAIAVGYDQVSGKPSTRFYLHANGRGDGYKFVSAIRTDIDWLAGKIRLDANFDDSNDVITLMIYTNYLSSEQVLTIVRIDTSTVMYNVSSTSNTNIARNIINEVASLSPINSYPQNANVAFELYESRIILHRLVAGDNKQDSARHDYVEIKDGGYEYVARDQQIDAQDTSKLIALNDGLNDIFLREYDTYRVDIQGLSLSVNGSIEFIIASNDAPSHLAPGAPNRNRTLKLVYSNGELKFIFDHYGHLSYAQSIDIGDINLADGNAHTIIVNISREQIIFFDANITGNNDVYASKVTIVVDGENSAAGYYPYSNNANGWVFQEAYTPSVTSQKFIGRLTWAGAKLIDASVQELSITVGEGMI